MTLLQRVRALLTELAKTAGIYPETLLNISIGISLFLAVVGLVGLAEIGPVFGGLLVVAVITGGASISGRMLFSSSSRPKRINKKPDRITDAQVYAMIDRRSKVVTPSRVARATSSTPEAALEKLRSMHADNKLEIDSAKSETELVFYRKNA